jgi:Leucine-rich repeat (LRR) protein
LATFNALRFGNLTTLILSNFVGEIPSDFGANYPELAQFTFQNCKIPSGILKSTAPLPKVSSYTITNCIVSEVNFTLASNATVISVSNTNLTKIALPPSLVAFSGASNALSTFPDFPQSTATIFMSYNLFTTIPQLPLLPNLTVLLLYYNQISSIDPSFGT